MMVGWGGGGLRSKIDGSLIIKCFTLIDSEAGLKRSNSIANVKTLMLFFPFFFAYTLIDKQKQYVIEKL